MASLLDEIRQQNNAAKGPACSVGVIFGALDKTDREHLKTALSDLSLSAAAIVRALKNNGHVTNDGAVQRHRKGECRCSDRGIS